MFNIVIYDIPHNNYSVIELSALVHCTQVMQVSCDRTANMNMKCPSQDTHNLIRELMSARALHVHSLHVVTQRGYLGGDQAATN